MNINMERLQRNLINLGKIGFEEGKGITRLPYTRKYEEANQLIKDLMLQAGLEVYQDPVGNLFGKIRGKQTQKTILVGSHIDTVPNGGMFDGSVGVLAALECMQTLIENDYYNKNDLEVVVFIAEEMTDVGSSFGSRCFTGEITHDSTLQKYMDKVGLSWEDIENSQVSPENIKSYLEMHVEQGGILDTEKIPIGVVTGIAGISRFWATVKGEANHSGSTPMYLRKDALIKSSEIILKFNQIVNKIGSPLVGTVGYINAFPGAVNVIPGKVNFSMELRDIDVSRVKEAVNILQEETKELDFKFEQYQYEEEVLLDESVQNCIRQSCANLNYPYKDMHSGAGHDASVLSRVTPTGMIFIPSKDGISHSPKEWTDWEDIEKGANVLLRTITHIDDN